MATLHPCESLSASNQQILATLESLITQHDNQFSLALAGGNTPKDLYREMSSQPWDWAKIQVTLTDERWVDTSHSDSNEKMIRNSLLINEAAQTYFLPLKNDAQTAQEGQQVCETSLATLIPKLDCVILGMGEDGHFASIFPDMDNTQDLLNRESSALCMSASPKDTIPRMSLSLAYLLTANQVILLCTGEPKRQILEQVSQGQGSHFPIFHIVNQHSVPVDIYWSPT